MSVSYGNFPIWRGSKGSSTGCEGVLWDPRDPLRELAALPVTAQVMITSRLMVFCGNIRTGAACRPRRKARRSRGRVARPMGATVACIIITARAFKAFIIGTKFSSTRVLRMVLRTKFSTFLCVVILSQLEYIGAARIIRVITLSNIVADTSI
jgi:hypothetical protein